MTLKNNRTPLLSNIKLCASFHHNMWIQTGVTVRKRPNGVMTSVTLTFDLWPWPFAWTSRMSMVIIPENFRMIRWEEHCQKGVTVGQPDGQPDRQTKQCQFSFLIYRIIYNENKCPCYTYMQYQGFIQNFPWLMVNYMKVTELTSIF